MGRPALPIPDNYTEVYELWKTGEITGVEAAAQCGLSRSTFRYKVMKYEEKQKKEQQMKEAL